MPKKLNVAKQVSTVLLLSMVLASCSNRQVSSAVTGVTVQGASDAIREVAGSTLSAQNAGDLGSALGLTPLVPPEFKLTYTLDLREQSLFSLSPEDRQKLMTASGVEVILSDGRKFSYTNAEGHVLYEGDIALTTSQNIVSYILGLETGRNQLGQQGILQTNIWPNNTVFYYWNSGAFNASHEATIKRSIELWNQAVGGAVKWVWNPNAQHKVQFISSKTACGWSYVGRIGNTQQLGLNPSCNTTHTVIHEMGHAAGMWHEHQRCDRDQYVRVTNLQDTVNMGKNCNLRATTFGDFDYDSVMNYGPSLVTAISTTGPYQGNPRNLGRVPSLSKGDIESFWRLYRKTSAPTTGGGVAPSPTPPAPAPAPAPTPTPSPSWIQGPVYRGNTTQAGSVQYAPTNNDFQVTRAVNLFAQLTASSNHNYELFLLENTGGRWVLAAQGNAGPTSSVQFQARPGINYRWAIRNNVGVGSYTVDVKVGELNTRPDPDVGGVDGGGFDPPSPAPAPTPAPAPAPAPAITKVSSSNWSTMMNYSKDRLVIIDVGAPAWCRPCQALEPYIEAAAQKANGKWVLGMVDVDYGSNKSLAQQLGVDAYPTIIAIKNGKVIGKSYEVHSGNLNSWINQYLSY